MVASRLEGIMAASARMLMERARPSFNHTVNETSPFFQMATNRTGVDNATLHLISSLVFAESKSVRTSTIILAAFNVLASFATAASILYDCYWASKRCNPKFKASKFCVSSIHPAETFPLVLAIGIVIQGLVFAGVQGEGLKSLFTTGCETIGQFMWPALFIVPYLQLVFGLECAIRSFRSIPFQARGKYDVTICLVIVLIMLIITWIPSHIWPESDTCFASLVWFIMRYGKLGSVLLSVTSGLMILSALTIFIRLSMVNLIDQHQRIAASRMVYYLVLGIVSMAFVLPYFFSLIDKDGDIKLAMMATVVLNLSGLMSGLLQLFLRSNTATTSFGPKVGRSWDRGKHEIRIFGPNELAMHSQLVNPVTGPRTPGSAHELNRQQSRTDSRASLMGPEKSQAISISMDSLPSPPSRSPKTYDDMPAPLEPTFDKSPTRGHTRNKPSYSLFPAEGGSPTKPGQPVSIYDISDLAPPPPVYGNGGSRHRRDSSIASSATVQIGLRLSHAPGPSKEDLDCLPLPSTSYKAPPPPSPESPLSLSSKYSASPLPSTTYSATPVPKPAPPPSPLRVQTDFPAPAPPPRSPKWPSPAPAPIITRQPSPEQSPTRSSPAAVNKTLPPTPKAFIPAAVKETQARESTTQLSPAVYSPAKQLPAKIKTAVAAASFGGPMSANPLKGNSALPSSLAAGLVRSNSQRPAASSSQQEPAKDWI
ncbi:hypothetical protein BDZ45DRAFT_142762 [Acephala macrosclerotiorum]|nr:hypothetical protein BDZ45DRAFT_142762 [Acephala macrosclerotiorum]